ncbi:MAG TPA: hypothetical protein VE713_10580 [Pyrinomonadaceae bacterium]|jgi:hypothetical protein|nr:hypothetical protein [Pyrinomonadaceae bacterium]
MPKKLIKAVEVMANVAVLIAAVSLSVALFKTYVIPTAARGTSEGVADDGHPQPIRKGDKVNLPGVDWAKNGQTLLLVLSSGCHYCTESAPFYQRLTKGSDVNRIALLPQPADEGRRYVDSLGITVGEVRQVSLNSLRVPGTPTILIVDKNGVVTDSWVGLLSSEEEAALLSRVQMNRTGG